MKKFNVFLTKSIKVLPFPGSFFLKMPLDISPQNAILIGFQPNPLEDRTIMERNKRILVVDDQQDLCDQLSKLLLRSGKKNETLSLVQQMRAKLMGSADDIEDEDSPSEEAMYQVDTANQGETAFEMVKKANFEGKPYAVVFLDMRMPPGWDGLKTAKSIRDIDKEIEIVIMTAYADHDQKQIAETVGTPEKLLYIKKPFQAEEIYQLALSLTSKWSLEYAEKERKKWLEVLLKGIIKIKSFSISEKDNIFNSTLKSFVDFNEAKKGFIALWAEDAKKWNIVAVHKMEAAEAESFVAEKSSAIFECRTIQHFEDKYLMPMKKDGFFAVAVMMEEKVHSDPEWYKLLCLFVMSAAEALSNAMLMNEQLSKEKSSAVGEAVGRFKEDVRAGLDRIRREAESLKSDKIQAELKELESVLARQ